MKTFNLDKLLHWVKCRIVPGYRKNRICETKRLIEELKASRKLLVEKNKIMTGPEQRKAGTVRLIEKLKASRKLLIENIEKKINGLELIYRRLCAEDAFHPLLRKTEKRLIYYREILQTLKSGKRQEDFNVRRFLQTIQMTADDKDLEHGFQSRKPDQQE